MFKETLRRHLAKRFDNHELRRWFDPLHMDMDEQEGILRVSFPHAFFGDWFMHTVRGDFERGASACSELSFPVLSIVYEGANFRIKNQGNRVSSSSFVHPAHALQGNVQLKGQSFDDFLVNRKNDFPVAAAKAFVAQELSETDERLYFSPFVVYGQSGSGKSLLLCAMLDAMRGSGRPYHYGDISFLEGIRISPGRYAKVNEKMIFLDDAHRVTSCPELQDALVALVDMFQSTGRLLVLAFDAHPSSCAGLAQNLRTRLCSGLVVELKRPDLDIRRQYVQRQNALRDLGLSKEQILGLAQKFQDLRNIDGALARLLAYRSLVVPDNPERRNADVSALFSKELENQELTPAHIIASCTRKFSVSPEEMVGKSREKTVTFARHVAIWLCRELLGLSLVRIGRIFGGRDHSSILYSINKINSLQKSDRVMHKLLADLRVLCVTGQT